ncbi:hypothetical protein O181_044716 [Austropuccinia psidii MF-1]|uniref:Uncharacterized protein n=1 Tax=Austropuccinia psidii MF-1 TaxID=1389203 RepID=A0A9Q3HH43_9BASI|nr:hypothetical protein [Austropuccinia psidii MF-1]
MVLDLNTQTKGEALSFRELDLRRLWIHLCSPESKGWHAQPSKGMELCNMAKVDKMEVPDNNEDSIFVEMNLGDVKEISGLYEENILEAQENQKKEEDTSENIHNMEEYPSMNKGLEHKKDSKSKSVFNNISKKYGKQGTMWKKKQETILKEDYSHAPMIEKLPRIKAFISKIFSKIKRNHQYSNKWDF